MRPCRVAWIKDGTGTNVGSRERSYKKTHNTRLLEHKAENCSEAPGAVTSVESANECGNGGAKRPIFSTGRDRSDYAR